MRCHKACVIITYMPKEEIEDVSERYHIFDSIEFNSDTVKKIRIKNNKLPVYVISLIEHKSNVDYNVTMQILKYMMCIWKIGKGVCEARGRILTYYEFGLSIEEIAHRIEKDIEYVRQVIEQNGNE